MALSDNNLSDNLKGAGLMAAAMTSFTLNDILLKLLADDVPLFQAIALRGVLTSAMIAVVAWWLGALSFRFSGRDWRLLSVRGMAEALAAFFFLTALFHMPIANITAILQALPLAVTLASALFLGEAVGWRRFVAIGVGFAGVMLIVRPGTDGFTIYAVFGLLTVVVATVRDLMARQLSKEVPSLTATLITALAVTAFAFVMAPTGEAWVPLSPRHLLILTGASVLILLAYLTIVMAMRVGEIGFVAPFRYTGLVVAVIAGLLVFGDWPDGLTLLGSAIVVGSGLYALWRERQVKRRQETGRAPA